MKVKVNKPDSEKRLGYPDWDGSRRIGGKVYRPGKIYIISKEFYDNHKAIFTQIKEDND